MYSLVVDDDPDYAAIVEHTLKRDGHEVVVVHSARAARSFSTKRAPGLAVLDIVLSDGSGIDLCDELRQHIPDLPVILLSSRSRPDDIADGLNAGADDYLTKPFHPAELLARVSAVLRRSSLSPSPDEESPETSGSNSAAGGLVISESQDECHYGGKAIRLTQTERDILVVLAEYPGETLGHAFLSQKIWGYSNAEGSILLKGHVSAIRRKLREVGAPPDTIKTIHNVGYCYMGSK